MSVAPKFPPSPVVKDEPAKPVVTMPETNRGLLKGIFVGVCGLLTLASFYTLYFAQALFIPITLAVLLSLVLSPPVRRLARLGVPQPLGAALVVLAALTAIGYGVASLSTPAAEWLARAPESFSKAEQKLRSLRRMVQDVQQATKQVEALTDVGDTGGTRKVVIKGPSLAERFVSRGLTVVVTAAMMVVLLYFLLASGDLFLAKLVKVLPRLRDKKRAVEMARQIQTDVSRYLFTTTLTNASLGAVTAVAMFAVGMPNPVLWGVMAAVLEFIPFVGWSLMAGVLTLVALVSFEDWTSILLPPVTYLILHLVKSEIISPYLLGARLMLNPVTIFVAVLVWGWLWGIPGALLAVPLLAVIKIVCDHITPLHPIGAFLGPRGD
ncbi:MAG: AI-2E family transporter [Pseudomonadota bacterium]|nr:AI-2E family transporter [Pseudomonadota bacterium]